MARNNVGEIAFFRGLAARALVAGIFAGCSVPERPPSKERTPQVQASTVLLEGLRAYSASRGEWVDLPTQRLPLEGLPPGRALLYKEGLRPVWIGEGAATLDIVRPLPVDVIGFDSGIEGCVVVLWLRLVNDDGMPINLCTGRVRLVGENLLGEARLNAQSVYQVEAVSLEFREGAAAMYMDPEVSGDSRLSVLPEKAVVDFTQADAETIRHALQRMRETVRRKIRGG